MLRDLRTTSYLLLCAALTCACVKGSQNTCPVQAAALPPAPAAAPMSRTTELANLPFERNRPTSETAAKLREELLFQRAMQTYLWALPLLNTLGMKDGSEATFGAGYNVLPIWKKRLDAKTLITTPNSDVLYALSYLDVGKDGPIVFEAPPMLQGILMDVWQRPLPVDGGKFAGDVGLPGPDAGKGGKFLILPPGYTGKVPTGYFVYRSDTNNVFVFLRGFYQDPKDLAPAVALMEQAKFYPLADKANAKPMSFPDASGVAVDMLPHRDASAFDQLKHLVDAEGSKLAEPDWLGMLATLGIVKDQPFQPDAQTRKLFDDAARAAYKTSRVIGFQETIGAASYRVYADRRWLNPINNATPRSPTTAQDLTFTNTAFGYRALDARIWFSTDYYSMSPGMVSQIPGKGAFYGVAFTDADGVVLDGDGTYHITLPSNVPVELFWSLTLYEAENGSGLANGRPFPSLGSRDQPAANADGTITLYLGPTAPAGKEANWLATAPGRGFFAILRLYGPRAEALDHRWKPGDIEKGW